MSPVPNTVSPAEGPGSASDRLAAERDRVRMLRALISRPGAPGRAHLVALTPNQGDGRPEGRSIMLDADDAADQVGSFVRAFPGRNHYVHMGEFAPGFRAARASVANIAATFALWFDRDPQPGETPEAVLTWATAVVSGLQAVGLGPDIVVHSGNGVQLHWLTARMPFVGPAAIPRETVKGWVTRLAAALGGDPAVADVARIMRLPETDNLPSDAKRRKGRAKMRATLAFVRNYDPARRRLDTPDDIEAMVTAIEAWAATNAVTPHPLGTTSGAPVRKTGPSAARPKVAHGGLSAERAEELAAGFAAARNDLDRNLWVQVMKAGFAGLSPALGEERARAILHAYCERWAGSDGLVLGHDPDALDRVIAEDTLPDGIGAYEVAGLLGQRGWAGAGLFRARLDFADADPVNDNAMPGATDMPPLPVLLQGTDIAATLDAFEASVTKRALPLFQRGAPVAVVRSRFRDRCGREASAAALHMLTAPNMIEFASRHFDVRKPGRKGEPVPAVLSQQAAAAYLDRGQWGLPTIGALAHAPALSRSGRIVSAPGFDAESGLYIADRLPGFTAPDPGSWSSEADARAAGAGALAKLLALVEHYSFATSADRSVAIAAMLTPFAVHAGVRGPLFAFNGTGPGVGKSKLVDATAVLVTGARAQTVTQGVSEAEFEKHMKGKVLEGVPLLNIDNVERPLEGDTLNAMLTQERLSVRPLGTSRTVTVEPRLTLYATGNNLVVRGDMARRVLTCRIDPGVERPELRRFPFDPAERAEADRAGLVSAVLTILAAHATCGFPGVPLLTSEYGSFEAWSKYVRAPLVWLGMADPLDVTPDLREADPVLTRLGAVLAAIEAAVGLAVPFGAKDVVPGTAAADFGGAADGTAPDARHVLGSALRDALAEERIGRGTADAPSVGRYLGKHEGRVVHGLRLDRIRTDGKRGNLYRIARAAE